MFLSFVQDWAHGQHPAENQKEQKIPALAAVLCAGNDTMYLAEALARGTEQRSLAGKITWAFLWFESLVHRKHAIGASIFLPVVMSLFKWLEQWERLGGASS